MNRIKELRQKKGLSQGELAAMLSVSAAVVSGYEIEKYQADIKTYIKIADYFEVSLDYLFCRKEIENGIGTVVTSSEISDKYERLDQFDRGKAMGYIECLLANEKYNSPQIKKAVG